MSAFHEKIIKSASTFLLRWNGGEAEAYELTKGHKTLVLLVTKTHVPGNLVIACMDPNWISTPLRWRDCNIRVRLVNSGGENFYEIADSASQTLVRCGTLEIKENVKL